LDCDDDQLTNLDVSNNTALQHLSCSANQLTSLDISNNTALNYLYCGNNKLTTLDVSNNISLTFLAIMDMPSLYKVCVWEMPFPVNNIYSNGSPNVYFTMDCSK